MNLKVIPDAHSSNKYTYECPAGTRSMSCHL